MSHLRESIDFFVECDGLSDDDPADDDPAVDDADPFDVLTHYLTD
jgi:hypothetical protein